MKRVIIIFCLFLFPFAFVFPQTETDTACKQKIETVFKVRDFKEKYDIVKYIHNEKLLKSSYLFSGDGRHLDRFFILIKGFPYFEQQNDSISRVKSLTSVMSEEEVNRYIEQLNYTPQDAYKEYRDFIQNIKHEKEAYLKCIDAELAKGDTSEYKKEWMLFYIFRKPGGSIMAPDITKLDFLKVFKEFILNDDLEVLPDYSRVTAYLKCGCKI
ncbi:hypothetical protein SDC9_138076 [bioreactor metagenome]|uniref:Uncharacterized protein n=1 Tax=bioreactor metagenome TaxID=1076179 RepID=A0A645DQG0_9ZZZZ